MQSDILLNKRLFSSTAKEKMQLTTLRRKGDEKNILRISFRNIIKDEEEIRLLPVYSRENYSAQSLYSQIECIGTFSAIFRHMRIPKET